MGGKKGDIGSEPGTPPDAGGTSEAPNSEAPALIVGIGASAGGLESLRAFFSAMPADSGMAFVVIQHLQHGRKSMMAEVLSSYTRMPVAAAEDGMAVLRDHVYVIPADNILTIQKSKLRLQSSTADKRQRMPIDAFFLSLAETTGNRAVCIVMSGAGTDGTLGLRAVKEQGGLTLAEAIPRAGAQGGFESMPRSAVATGLVDFVAPAGEMPRHLGDYARHMHQVVPEKGLEGVRNDAAARLKDICEIVLARKGRDFRQYKTSTLVRRVQRRMQVLHLDSADAYVQLLRRDVEEVDRLSHDLLISVTRFFRDPAAFEALKAMVIKPLVKNCGPDDRVRIWVAGCTTGEEAYSIAILIQEIRLELDIYPNVHIFATDIDEEAVASARIGRYPRSVVQDIPRARLRRFFLEEDESYRVAKEVRDLCIFSVHDLIQDPPFSRLDLISCRNLLIYLDADLQKRLVPLFHYALSDRGCLFIGASENVTHHRDLFTPLDKSHRIYRRRSGVARPRLEFPATGTFQRADGGSHSTAVAASRPNILQKAERVVLEHYGPAFVVVDERQDVLQFSRGTGRYLEQPAGAPRTNLIEIARPGLRFGLRAALHKTRQTGKEVVQSRLALQTNGSTETVDIVASPISDKGEAETLYLVVFRPSAELDREAAQSPTPAQPGADDLEGSGEARAQQLERELADTRDDLQATIEELQTSNEEVQSANEELLSMNEELQSSNEELESSKEELQSVNEELETVNQELSHKVAELDRANADLRNLLDSTEIATVFLDRDFCMKGYTPTAKNVFNLIESDIGRPITDIAAKLEDAGVRDDLMAALRSGVAAQREVSLSDDVRGTFIMRVLPYRDIAGHLDGLVMTFMDVTALKRAEQESQKNARQTWETLADYRSLLDVAPVGIAIANDPKGEEVWINPYGARLLGLAGPKLVSGGSSHVTYRVLRDQKTVAFEDLPLQQALASARTLTDFEARIARADGTSVDVAISAAPRLDESGKVRGAIACIADITAAKAAQRRQRLLVSALQHRVKNLLANVRSLFRESIEGSETTEDFAVRFEGRLNALALAESIVARTGVGSVELTELVEEMLPPQIHDRDAVHIAGPEISLTPRAAQMIALALNELTTNAIKFGALCSPEGRVDVSWRLVRHKSGEMLELLWRETGVAPGSCKAVRRGFGLELIEHGLPYDLGGTAKVTFGKDSVTCRVRLPAKRHVVGHGASAAEEDIRE